MPSSTSRRWRLSLRLLGSLALGSTLNGCATTVVTELARPEPVSKRNSHPIRLNAAWYALVPLTVPFDLVTLPVQIVLFKNAFPSG